MGGIDMSSAEGELESHPGTQNKSSQCLLKKKGGSCCSALWIPGAAPQAWRICKLPHLQETVMV